MDISRFNSHEASKVGPTYSGGNSGPLKILKLSLCCLDLGSLPTLVNLDRQEGRQAELSGPRDLVLQNMTATLPSCAKPCRTN